MYGSLKEYAKPETVTTAKKRGPAWSVLFGKTAMPLIAVFSYPVCFHFSASKGPRP